jgi:hypothetical protein
MHIDASMPLLSLLSLLAEDKQHHQIRDLQAKKYTKNPCMHAIPLPRDLLGNILDTRVRLEFCRSALPIDLALAQILNNRDDGINRTDKLACGISFTVSSAKAHNKEEDKADRSVMVPFARAAHQLTTILGVRMDVHAKSTVHPKGVPSSSFLAYFLPIEAPESSTRLATPCRRILRAGH